MEMGPMGAVVIALTVTGLAASVAQLRSARTVDLRGPVAGAIIATFLAGLLALVLGLRGVLFESASSGIAGGGDAAGHIARALNTMSLAAMLAGLQALVGAFAWQSRVAAVRRAAAGGK